MWVRKWMEQGEAWGSRYEVEESELMYNEGEMEEIAAQEIIDNGELSETYFAIDDISGETIEFDAPYKNSFVEWYEGLSESEVLHLSIDEIVSKMKTSVKV